VAIGLVMENRGSSIAAGDHMSRTHQRTQCAVSEPCEGAYAPTSNKSILMPDPISPIPMMLSIVLYNEPDARSYIWQYGDEGLEPLLLLRVSLV